MAARFAFSTLTALEIALVVVLVLPNSAKAQDEAGEGELADEVEPAPMPTTVEPDPNTPYDVEAGVITGDQSDSVPLPPVRKTEDGHILATGEAPQGEEGATEVSRTDDEAVAVGGYVFSDFRYARPAQGDYTTTFRVRELELDVDAQLGPQSRVRVDLNFQNGESGAALAQDRSFNEALASSLVEQAYIEWESCGLKLRGGTMNAPFGVEALDANERLPLSRSRTSRKATPDILTGVVVEWPITELVEVYGGAFNGWDLNIETNRSPTAALGVRHGFGGTAKKRLYEGSLDGLVGPERPGSNDLRWIVDYSFTVQLGSLRIPGEVLVAGEQGRRLNRAGEAGPGRDASWAAGQLGVEWVGGDEAWRAGGRVEYLSDPDRFIDLPNRSGTDELFSGVVTGRVALDKGVEAGIEYRIDHQRGVGFAWESYQDVRVAVIGTF